MNQEPTIFTRIINREIPADIVFENERIIVVKDIHPKAPVHLLGITKQRFPTIHQLLQEEENKDLFWELCTVLASLAEQSGLTKSGYRLQVNSGEGAGQTVPHLHIHLLGGKQLAE